MNLETRESVKKAKHSFSNTNRPQHLGRFQWRRGHEKKSAAPPNKNRLQQQQGQIATVIGIIH